MTYALRFSTHTPHRWSRAHALDALLQAAEAWPGYTFRAMTDDGGRVLIFTNDGHHPIGWLGASIASITTQDTDR